MSSAWRTASKLATCRTALITRQRVPQAPLASSCREHACQIAQRSYRQSSRRAQVSTSSNLRPTKRPQARTGRPRKRPPAFAAQCRAIKQRNKCLRGRQVLSPSKQLSRSQSNRELRLHSTQMNRNARRHSGDAIKSSPQTSSKRALRRPQTSPQQSARRPRENL